MRAWCRAAQFKTLKPAGKRVCVKKAEVGPETAGGILLPDSAKDVPSGGEVVSVGEGCSLKVGANVLYSKYAGTELEIQLEDYVLLKEDDVIGLCASDNYGVAGLLPQGDRLLVKLDEAADVSEGGVLLTDSSKDKPNSGEVVAVGPGAEGEDGKTTPVAVEAGATVLYQKYSGAEFDGDNGEKFVVIKEADVIATLE